MGNNLPSVSLQKVNANAGTVTPGATGVVAYIAPASAGPANQAGSYLRPSDVQATFDEGPLVDWPAYHMAEAQTPVVLIRPTTSTAGVYNTIEKTISGTFNPVAGSAAAIADDYNVIVRFIAPGALGTAGITYQYSLDGGQLWSPVLQLGTALTINPAVPVTGADTGIHITLGTSTQTVDAGDFFTFTTTGPRMTSADLITALAALFASKLPWEMVLVHGETNATLINDIDAWIQSLEPNGRYKLAFANTRFKAQVDGSTTVAETEAAYATAMAAVVNGVSTINVVVGTDGAALVSPISGVTKRAPTALYDVVRSAVISVGVDPAEVDLGPLPNCDIDNANSVALFHDEAQNPGLDALRLTALRSFFDENGASMGTYICNSNILSAAGSDFTYSQYGRVMNLGCGIANKMLVQLLSQGVRIDPATGFILETQRAKWQSQVQKAINKALAGQVSGSAFTISKTDDLSGNGPATLTCTFQILGLKYVKTFAVTAEFVNTLPSAAA